MASFRSKNLIIVHGFRSETEQFEPSIKDTRQMHNSAEWCKLQLRSTFNFGVKGA